jgi:hypothetical protein
MLSTSSGHIYAPSDDDDMPSQFILALLASGELMIVAKSALKPRQQVTQFVAPSNGWIATDGCLRKRCQAPFWIKRKGEE